MLTKSIKEVLWKTVLANGCFCFHKMKLYMPDGLSAASFNPRGCRLADPPTRRSADTASFVAVARPRCDLLCRLPSRLCDTYRFAQRQLAAKAGDVGLPENFESFCLISFHGLIARDERKIVLDCLPDEHSVKGISVPSQAHFPERDSADRDVNGGVLQGSPRGSA